MTWIVGLTGGIGSGKTQASNAFESLGVPVIDTDLISHAVTAPNGLAIPAIREAFGESLIDPSGKLDRVKMRELVFSDPQARHKLEAILHPLIAVKIDIGALLKRSPAKLLHQPYEILRKPL